jgi:transcription elongation factor S-II
METTVSKKAAPTKRRPASAALQPQQKDASEPAVPVATPASAAAASAASAAATTSNSQDDPVRATLVAFLSGPRCALTDVQSRDAEIGVFNWTLERAEECRIARNWQNPRFRSLYESKARSLAANLCPDSYVGNERVGARLRDGEFPPHALADMHADNIFPERWREVVEAKVRRDEYMLNAKPAAMTDQFRCGRCKKRECSYMELQMRSCDEPASIFVSCLTCGHRWRIG